MRRVHLRVRAMLMRANNVISMAPFAQSSDSTIRHCDRRPNSIWRTCRPRAPCPATRAAPALHPRCTRAAPASASDTRRPRPYHISRHISSARASPRRRTLATHTCILRCSGQATFSFAARPLAFQAGGQRTYTALTVSRCAASSTPRKCRARRARHLLARCRCAATVDPPHLSFTSGQPKRACLLYTSDAADE